nr:hypothetical protein [uncultured Holophaga sp.]
MPKAVLSSPELKERITKGIGAAAQKGLAIIPEGFLSRLDDNADELRDRLISLIWELSEREAFKDQEVPTESGYFSGYSKPPSLREQYGKLQELFGAGVEAPNWELVNLVEEGKTSPAGALVEGTILIPHWSTVAASHIQAIEKALSLVKIAYDDNFVDGVGACLTVEYLHEKERKTQAVEKLIQTQKTKSNIVWMQFGRNHRGRSNLRANEVMAQSYFGEYGFGLYETLVGLLLCPDRLRDPMDLWLSCDDEVSVDAVAFDGTHVPHLSVYGGKLRLGYRPNKEKSPLFGVSSWFPPQWTPKL